MKRFQFLVKRCVYLQRTTIFYFFEFIKDLVKFGMYFIEYDYVKYLFYEKVSNLRPYKIWWWYFKSSCNRVHCTFYFQIKKEHSLFYLLFGTRLVYFARLKRKESGIIPLFFILNVLWNNLFFFPFFHYLFYYSTCFSDSICLFCLTSNSLH